MELRKFITVTLTEIVEGVIDAQNELSGMGALISPKSLAENNDSALFTKADTERSFVDLVEFEVSLAESEKRDGGVSIGVIFGNTGIQGGKSKGTENNSLTRIKFSIPVRYPTEGNPKVKTAIR